MKNNNLNNENISKKIHFIFYLFKKNDKHDEKEIELIMKLYSFNIEMFFIITFITEDDEETSLSEFEEAIKKSFSKNSEGKKKSEEEKKKENETIKKIMKNTFCLDLLNVQYSNVICDIFEAINEKLKIYKQSNDNIIEYLFNYNYLKKMDNNSYEFIEGDSSLLDEKEKSGISKDCQNEGIVTPYQASDPNEVLSLIKSELKDNIFFIDINNDRENRKKLALDIVNSYKTPGFWYSTIPIPFLNEHLARKSKEKMIGEIVRVYNFVIQKKMGELDFKENNKNIWVKFIFKIGGFVAGMWNSERVDKLGKKIIDELDADYTQINILNVYHEMAQNLNKNFELLSDFQEKFNNSEYWYDINLN